MVKGYDAFVEGFNSQIEISPYNCLVYGLESALASVGVDFESGTLAKSFHNFTAWYIDDCQDRKTENPVLPDIDIYEKIIGGWIANARNYYKSHRNMGDGVFELDSAVNKLVDFKVVGLPSASVHRFFSGYQDDVKEFLREKAHTVRREPYPKKYAYFLHRNYEYVQETIRHHVNKFIEENKKKLIVLVQGVEDSKWRMVRYLDWLKEFFRVLNGFYQLAGLDFDSYLGTIRDDVSYYQHKLIYANQACVNNLDACLELDSSLFDTIIYAYLQGNHFLYLLDLFTFDIKNILEG